MSQNYRVPPPNCAAFAPLMPLASHDLLSEEQTTALHAHLAACLSCRAELATYDQAEEALRHAFRISPNGTPPLSRAEIMRTLVRRPDRASASSVGSIPSLPQAQFSQPPRRKRPFFAGVPAFAAALAMILIAVVIFGIPGLLPGLRGNKGAFSRRNVPAQTTPQAVADLTHILLNSISMVSPKEGWAVGVTLLRQPSNDPRLPAYGDPVILHYWQGRWSPVPLPSALTSHLVNIRLGCGVHCPGIILHSLSMVSATDGWAVGNTVLPPNADGVTVGIVLHYTGGQWVLDSYRDSALFSIFMRTASDGWIAGDGRSSGWSGSKGNAPAFHYTGKAWIPVNDPALASVLPRTIVALSATNVWVNGTDISGTGFDGDDPEVILHYDGSQWTREKTDLANSRVYGMVLLSPTEGWAVGSLSGGTGPHPAHPQKALVEQYSHGTWQQDTSFTGPPNSSGSSLYGIAMVSASEGWAIGSDGLIIHDLGGAWTQVSSPTDQTLESIAMLSPTEGWAVGDQGTILHYFNGAWGLYQGGK